MRIGTTLSAIGAGVLLFAGSASAGDVAGKWSAEFDTQIGVQKYTFEFALDGETLTGKATFERMGETGEVELQDGKISGDAISFVEMLDFQGNEISIHYTGTIKGDEIDLTRTVGDFAEEQFTAKRLAE